MALAIAVLVIGLPVGAFLLLRRRRAGTAEGDGHTGSVLPGIGVIAAAVLLAGLSWYTDSGRHAAETENQQRQNGFPYVAPPPEDRGELPLIGYTVEPQEAGGQLYTLYFLQPLKVLSGHLKYTGVRPEAYYCLRWVDGDVGADPLKVRIRLSWEPSKPPPAGESDRCRVGNLEATSIVAAEAVTVSGTPAVLTDSAIVDVHGKVLAPAAPGNVVPKLDAPPSR